MEKFPYLLDNLRALEEQDAPVIKWLSSQRIDMELMERSLIRNKSNLLDWAMVSGQGIFESLPPGAHYKGWIPESKAETSCTIIVGANIGYGTNHVLANSPNTHKVLLLEPRPELLLACLGQTDYRPFFNLRKLHILPPDGEYLDLVIRNLDLHYVYGNIFLKSDMACRQLGPEYARWTEVIKEKLENFSVELNTLRLKQDVMVGNEIRNFGRAMRDGSLMTVRDAARGASAVILGAGPSLKEYAPRIAENPGYALYGSALQTLPALHSFGIKPHFCMAIDFHKHGMMNVYQRLDKDWAADIPLIYSTKMDPEVLASYPGPTIPLWTLGGLATFLMQDHELVLDAAGNVGVTLFRFFQWAGASQVLLVGQDFAWRGASSHVQGHHAAGNDQGPYAMTTQDADGASINTTIQLMTAKRDLEKDLSEAKIPVYNLYGGGAPIRFSRQVGLDDVWSGGLLASTPGSIETFLAAMHQARRPAPRPPITSSLTAWTAYLRNETKDLEKLFKKLDRNQQEIHRRFEHAYNFAKGEPLYTPYLFNEILDLAGLIHARFSYAPRDLGEFKKIAKRITTKIREMDHYLAMDRKSQAA